MGQETSGPEASTGSAIRRGRPLWLVAVVNVLAMLAVVSLVQAFIVRVHNVSSSSMQVTLGVTDRVLSSPLPYRSSSPTGGDIVIFAHGDTWDSSRRPKDPNPIREALRVFGDITGIGISHHHYTVKRVVGVEGETVTCCDAQGRVEVNGVAAEEPYVYQDLPFASGTLDCDTTPRSSRCFPPITVPAGELLVMGDHRSNSADSVASCRGSDVAGDCARFVEVDQVTGKVIGRVWPPGRVA